MSLFDRLQEQNNLFRMALGHQQATVQALDEILRTQPDKAELHYMKASLLYKTGQCQEALPSYDRAISLAPNNLLCMSFNAQEEVA